MPERSAAIGRHGGTPSSCRGPAVRGRVRGAHDDDGKPPCTLSGADKLVLFRFSLGAARDVLFYLCIQTRIAQPEDARNAVHLALRIAVEQDHGYVVSRGGFGQIRSQDIVLTQFGAGADEHSVDVHVHCAAGQFACIAISVCHVCSVRLSQCGQDTPGYPHGGTHVRVEAR
jgi:hypothetical protein